MIVTAGARSGLDRCRRFLASRNPAVSGRASAIIREAFRKLADHPEIGRPVEGAFPLRELIIGFGASGYVALYTFDAEANEVLILAFRHQKEAGY